ncbi:MAG: UDP-N-acetylglucosamine--N-acetylmuramyl-(pentapeptide) pyrophosphoryl-undecaprenol N-acetylglucosamine transferase [Candidatus Falkowbacteria bacterium]|nr:UDP-N-acetylglucosamine--N-acetylmuramyl-(pentapeptide) pyrophosphoryl-undecaprenol N-acetylglucosamine transferase [Candidatus Falkowbacteria bacterium]
MNRKRKILIALSGGGTGGPVVPLLSVARVLAREHPEVEFIFFGTADGPEVSLVENETKNFSIKYLKISSGKLRRYFSWRNFFDIFSIVFAFGQSFYYLIKYRPRVLLSVGAFVAVPPACAAWLLRIPVFMHQQDFRPGLANQLIAPLASLKTVAFEKSVADYSRAQWIGNPADDEELSIAVRGTDAICKKYHLNKKRPVILVTGGGTGADFLNNLVVSSLPKLSDFQVIHLSGEGKERAKNSEAYQSYGFLPHSEIIGLMAVSDLVISRCGLSTLTEISLLAKPAILVPMPNSHQEDNAKIFSEAAFVLDQKSLTVDNFVSHVHQILNDKAELVRMSSAIKKIVKPGAANFLADKIYEYSGKKS